MLAEVEARRSLARDNLAPFTEIVGGFLPAAHHRLICEHLEAVAWGVIDRLQILMPPGSAKST